LFVKTTTETQRTQRLHRESDFWAKLLQLVLQNRSVHPE
jgi:hypothetical protein